MDEKKPEEMGSETPPEAPTPQTDAARTVELPPAAPAAAGAPPTVRARRDWREIAVVILSCAVILLLVAVIALSATLACGTGHSRGRCERGYGYREMPRGQGPGGPREGPMNGGPGQQVKPWGQQAPQSSVPLSSPWNTQ
ncbi:MAG TPA: hypothetical protein VIK22_03415 [Candidatus Anoxymicrobiaceae bacterium]